MQDKESATSMSTPARGEKVSNNQQTTTQPSSEGRLRDCHIQKRASRVEGEQQFYISQRYICWLVRVPTTNCDIRAPEVSSRHKCFTCSLSLLTLSSLILVCSSLLFLLRSTYTDMMLSSFSADASTSSSAQYGTKYNTAITSNRAST